MKHLDFPAVHTHSVTVACRDSAYSTVADVGILDKGQTVELTEQTAKLRDCDPQTLINIDL